MVDFIYPNSGANILRIRQITKTFSNFFSIFQYEAGGWQTFSSNCQSCFTLLACMAEHSKGTPLPHMMTIIEIRVFVFDISISCSKQRSIALDREGQLVVGRRYYPTLGINNLDNNEGETCARKSSLVEGKVNVAFISAVACSPMSWSFR